MGVRCVAVTDDLGAVHEDVPFDWAGADALIAAFESMADEIELKRGDRASAAQGALTDWQGQAVQAFVDRVTVGDADAVELVGPLRDAAEDVRALRRAAQEEQDRREAARAYITAYEENERTESAWNDFTDWLGGEDFEPPPMPPPPSPEPHLSPPAGHVSAARS
jgi:hypothetical protein